MQRGTVYWGKALLKEPKTLPFGPPMEELPPWKGKLKPEQPSPGFSLEAAENPQTKSPRGLKDIKVEKIQRDITA